MKKGAVMKIHSIPQSPCNRNIKQTNHTTFFTYLAVLGLVGVVGGHLSV